MLYLLWPIKWIFFFLPILRQTGIPSFFVKFSLWRAF